MEFDSKFSSLSNDIGEKITIYPHAKQAKQTLGKLQARAAQRELLRESKGTKAKLKKFVLKFASDSNEKMFF